MEVSVNGVRMGVLCVGEDETVFDQRESAVRADIGGYTELFVPHGDHWYVIRMMTHGHARGTAYCSKRVERRKVSMQTYRNINRWKDTDPLPVNQPQIGSVACTRDGLAILVNNF